MQQEFGKERVFNGPIAEDFIMGTANGMSRFNDKLRIVIEGAEFADYFWPAMEQFVETTHEYWRTKGQFSPNITVRLGIRWIYRGRTLSFADHRRFSDSPSRSQGGISQLC